MLSAAFLQARQSMDVLPIDRSETFGRSCVSPVRACSSLVTLGILLCGHLRPSPMAMSFGWLGYEFDSSRTALVMS